MRNRENLKQFKAVILWKYNKISYVDDYRGLM